MWGKHLEHLGLSKKLTFRILSLNWLKSENEGFHYGLLKVQDTRCRAYHQAPETITLSACSVYAISAYVHRHKATLCVLYYLWQCYGIAEWRNVSGEIESVVEIKEPGFTGRIFSTLFQAINSNIVLLSHQKRRCMSLRFRDRLKSSLGNTRKGRLKVRIFFLNSPGYTQDTLLGLCI